MTTFEIVPVDRRQWWPLDYMDEMMPDGRATPSAWLYRLVRVWRWSDEVQCRFTAKDGPPRFIAITPLPAEPEAALTVLSNPQADIFAERA